MREALAENPKEGGKVKVYGMRFEHLPAPASTWGSRSRRPGTAKVRSRPSTPPKSRARSGGTPKHAELLEGRKGCAAKVAKAATPAPTPVPTPRPTPPPEATPVPTPTTLAPTPAPVMPSPTASAGKPPALDLASAARAYFAGRYGDAASTLASAAGGGGRAAAQALLLRSASRYALYRIGGEQDAPLRRRAAEDAAAARRADPGLMPDPAAFSPAFVKFFRDAP